MASVTIAFGGDAPKDGFTLKDVAWFTGSWGNTAPAPTKFEEHWSTPAGGAMMGMFRLVNPTGKAPLYEFLLIEETADGVFMRLRHFKAAMAEVEKEPIRLKLTKATPNYALFENPDNEKPKRITYRFAKDEDEMTVTVESTRDGKPVSFTLKMQRMKK
jgi:hypothetical protein